MKTCFVKTAESVLRRILYGLPVLFFSYLGVTGSSALAQSNSVDIAKSMAKTDLVSAQGKIEHDYQSATEQCSKRPGPAAKACQIQALAAREAAEKDAEIVVDRAGETAPLADKTRKKVADDTRAKARDDYKIAVDKIMRADRLAMKECAKLNGAEHKSCSAQVAARTADAKASAKHTYGNDIERAKALTSSSP